MKNFDDRFGHLIMWVLILIAGVVSAAFAITARIDELEARIEQLESQRSQLNRLAIETILEAKQ